MTEEELNAILEKHKKWLAGDPDGARADLHGADLSRADLHAVDLSRADLHSANLVGANLSWADLTYANLSEADLRSANLGDAGLLFADLRSANLDYSAWPMWCGSLNVKIDKRLACQLLYHTLRAMQSVDDPEVQAVCNGPANIALANQFHRVEECGRIEPKSEETQEETK